MANFRKNQRHKLEKENFSVGSIITGEHDFIVVELPNGRVGLLDTKTWQILAGKDKVGLEVHDPNWLTYDEAGELAGLIPLNWTRSDFDYINEGLKK